MLVVRTEGLYTYGAFGSRCGQLWPSKPLPFVALAEYARFSDGHLTVCTLQLMRLPASLRWT